MANVVDILVVAAAGALVAIWLMVICKQMLGHRAPPTPRERVIMVLGNKYWLHALTDEALLGEFTAWCNNISYPLVLQIKKERDELEAAHPKPKE